MDGVSGSVTNALIDGNAFAQEVSLSMEFEKALFDTSHKGKQHEQQNGDQIESSYEVEFNYQTVDKARTAYEACRTAFVDGTEVTFEREEDGSGVVETAQALVASISRDYDNNSKATVTIEFQPLEFPS